MNIPKVDLSEKGGLPNGVRDFVQAVLFVAAGACVGTGHWIWFLALALAGSAIFAINAKNYYSNNYLNGYADGHNEGSRARGLISPEEEMLEGNYEVLASAPLGDGCLVAIRDLNSSGGEARVYRLKTAPPQFFRRERWKHPESSDPNAYIPGYASIQKPA